MLNRLRLEEILFHLFYPPVAEGGSKTMKKMSKAKDVCAKPLSKPGEKRARDTPMGTEGSTSGVPSVGPPAHLARCDEILPAAHVRADTSGQSKDSKRQKVSMEWKANLESVFQEFGVSGLALKDGQCEITYVLCVRAFLLACNFACV